MKKRLLFLVVLFFGLFLSACRHVEDTNGLDDYTIETFTDDDIIYSKKASFAFGVTKGRINDSGKMNARKLSGVEELFYVNVDGKNLLLEFNVKCEKGNLRVVVIHNNEIIKDIKINDKDTFAAPNTNGKYIVKVVGESASFKINYKIKQS